MKKIINHSYQVFCLVLLLFITGQNTVSMAQVELTVDDDKRRISVNGLAEMEIDPDEIIYQITIKEYWEEEFQPGKKYEDYKTKVPLAQIEGKIIQQLYAAGVGKDDIRVSSMGNYHRPSGKEILVGKTIELSLKSFSVIDEIAKTIDSRGVSNMNIVELKNKEMEAYKLQVKAEALKNAKKKADALLKALGQKCDKVLYIDETDSRVSYPSPMRENFANVRSASDGAANSPQTLKKIKIRYEVFAIFSIAD